MRGEWCGLGCSSLTSSIGTREPLEGPVTTLAVSKLPWAATTLLG